MRNFNAFVAVILDLNVNLLFKKYDKQIADIVDPGFFQHFFKWKSGVRFA